jgi:hypothetical protein
MAAIPVVSHLTGNQSNKANHCQNANRAIESHDLNPLSLKGDQISRL